MLGAEGDVLPLSRAVKPEFELGALLKQAEERGKCIVFQSVEGSPFPVVGSLLTSPERFALALGIANRDEFDAKAHAECIAAAIQIPVACTVVADAPCKEVIAEDAAQALSALPVPTFFKGDSGPYLTAAVGIARNPVNGVLNAGFYRVLLLESGVLAVSVSPGSDLHGFIRAAAEDERRLDIALVLGADPALLMTAAAKVPGNISELDVAGALQGDALQVVKAESSDLLVPADAEFVIELELDPTNRIENTMGEFGDTYGTQTAYLSEPKTVSHRHDAIFHVVGAGAGREHNTIGTIVLYGVEPELLPALREKFPGVVDIRLVFDPPAMGSRGDLFIACANGRAAPARDIYQFVYEQTCGSFPLMRIVRRIVLVDADLDIDNRRQLSWAEATRATVSSDYSLLTDDGDPVRMGIDARTGAKKGLEVLEVPNQRGFSLDD